MKNYHGFMVSEIKPQVLALTLLKPNESLTMLISLLDDTKDSETDDDGSREDLQNDR